LRGADCAPDLLWGWIVVIVALTGVRKIKEV